jgi:hypothetical protein
MGEHEKVKGWSVEIIPMRSMEAYGDAATTQISGAGDAGLGQR